MVLRFEFLLLNLLLNKRHQPHNSGAFDSARHGTLMFGAQTSGTARHNAGVMRKKPLQSLRLFPVNLAIIGTIMAMFLFF
jgi:hypothetical protein